ncbi:MAG: sensor domain-containing diguanylate cyclase [Lachnospiraceae bacterium]|nr:sensor domain-containing diguanylate cyclase [Lachnospiraceae bacterium]
MDYQAFCDANAAMTCVVSVEKLKDGRPGKFRIVTGNKAYIDSIEHPAPGTRMLTDRFIPNSEYTLYLTRDLNFEDYCYRAAVEGKCLHSYAHPDRMPVWFNMTFLPLSSDEEDMAYCSYTMEINMEAHTEKMSAISGDLASAVLETGLKIRGASDFRKAMQDVIKDIRDLCDAEHCCVLLMNHAEHCCTVLCEALSDNTVLKPMGVYLDENFYRIAASWESTVIAGSNCLIAKNDHDMEVVRERNPVWYESITAAGGKNIVLFPLRSQGELLGYIWAINFNPENSVKIKETLELSTFILGSEIGNYLMIDRLKILSSRDMLTGVMNRNEMNNYVDRLTRDPEKDEGSVGVIFADLNGLKKKNDNEGHEAGDQLLRNAAACLRRIFDEERIFRAGGDEFVMFLSDITEADVAEKIAMIREKSQEYEGLSFSIGGGCTPHSGDIRKALRMADQRMYEDKRVYYETHTRI